MSYGSGRTSRGQALRRSEGFAHRRRAPTCDLSRREALRVQHLGAGHRYKDTTLGNSVGSADCCERPSRGSNRLGRVVVLRTFRSCPDAAVGELTGNDRPRLQEWASMTTIEPGWYPDPAEPATQRYWDGAAWVGKPVPADAEPPAEPEPVDPEPDPLLKSSKDAAAPDPAVETLPMDRSYGDGPPPRSSSASPARSSRPTPSRSAPSASPSAGSPATTCTASSAAASWPTPASASSPGSSTSSACWRSTPS